MPAWRSPEGGERGAVCCTPDTGQRGLLSGGRDPQGCALASASVLSPLPSFPFPLHTTQNLCPCADPMPGPGAWVTIKHTSSFGGAERDGPLMSVLYPPAFQRPVLSYCAHILSLFVCWSRPPAPQPPCRSNSCPDQQIKAARLTKRSCYQSNDKQRSPAVQLER